MRDEDCATVSVKVVCFTSFAMAYSKTAIRWKSEKINREELEP